uniref:Uncharacterized protein n=1 Tax=Bionectria ochroleuca TaxID=29856 RepID=A0A8H7KD08_BIOOC
MEVFSDFLREAVGRVAGGTVSGAQIFTTTIRRPFVLGASRVRHKPKPPAGRSFLPALTRLNAIVHQRSRGSRLPETLRTSSAVVLPNKAFPTAPTNPRAAAMPHP